ncbi:MAG: hypothetical protein KKH01_01095 [Firmicutes bacterium]|nr:hypothetical protein [Bacillota bacterium]
MRKSILTILLTLCLSFYLMSCTESGEDTAKSMIQTLEDAGYVIESQDSEAIDSFMAHILLDGYSINATISALYIGYINENERWVQLIVFENKDLAAIYIQALYDEQVSGRLSYVSGYVVMITYSQETVDLFEIFQN